MRDMGLRQAGEAGDVRRSGGEGALKEAGMETALHKP